MEEFMLLLESSGDTQTKKWSILHFLDSAILTPVSKMKFYFKKAQQSFP